MWQGREEVGSQLQSRWAQSASRGGRKCLGGVSYMNCSVFLLLIQPTVG